MYQDLTINDLLCRLGHLRARMDAEAAATLS